MAHARGGTFKAGRTWPPWFPVSTAPGIIRSTNAPLEMLSRGRVKVNLHQDLDYSLILWDVLGTEPGRWEGRGEAPIQVLPRPGSGPGAVPGRQEMYMLRLQSGKNTWTRMMARTREN